MDEAKDPKENKKSEKRELENKWKDKQMQRQTNAWATCQGRDGSGLGENIAVVAEGEPQGMYRSFLSAAH